MSHEHDYMYHHNKQGVVVVSYVQLFVIETKFESSDQSPFLRVKKVLYCVMGLLSMVMLSELVSWGMLTRG